MIERITARTSRRKTGNGSDESPAISLELGWINLDIDIRDFELESSENQKPETRNQKRERRP